MLTSESLQKRINTECEEMDIDTTSLDTPSITPLINYSLTVQHWIDINSSNSIYIIFRYKTDLRK